MIGIKECCNNIENIAQEHTDFIVNSLTPIIDFYIELYEIKISINLNTRYKTINRKVKNIGNLSAKKKKFLLQALFRNKNEIKTIKDYYKIKSSQLLKLEANNDENVLNSLRDLKDDLIEIISFKLYEDNPIPYRQANVLNVLYAPIDFLQKFIFNYNWFLNLKDESVWNPYKITEKLGLKVCPYCNRQYTFTVFSGGTKTTRPELDHFLTKSEYPLFALSFYNLIPSCTVCNRDLKGKSNFQLNTHLNPYINNPDHSLLRYDYTPLSVEGASGISDEIKIELKINDGLPISTINKLQGNLNVFKYDDIAMHHTDVVQEIIRKRYFSEDKYLEILINTFSKANLTLSEAYLYAYGNFYNEKDFAKRPLAKLTKDIAIYLGSIHQFKIDKN